MAVYVLADLRLISANRLFVCSSASATGLSLQMEKPKVTARVKAVSSTLYRLLLHPSDAQLDGELLYDDDEWRFREKGLDIQDFVPSYIDVHQYATRKDAENNILVEEQLEPEFQSFAYSFSYIPDPTWLVNWENGSALDDAYEYESEMIELHEQCKK